MKVHKFSSCIGLIDVSTPATPIRIGVYVLMGKKVALLDTGPTSSLENLFSGLKELGVNPGDVSYILASHVHLDHTGGVGGALKHLPNARVVVHEKGRPHLVHPLKLWQGSLEVSGEMTLGYGQPEPVPRERLIVAHEGMNLDLGGREIEVLLTPGHASHGLSFFDRNGRNLFVGETVGAYYADIDLPKPATPPPFNLEQMLTSLDRLISLSPETLYYSHFGKAENALEKLLFHRQQLLLWGRIIAENMELDWQEIFRRIEEEDKSLERISRLPPDRQQAEQFFIRTSIQGYIEYFRKQGTAYLDSIRDRR